MLSPISTTEVVARQLVDQLGERAKQKIVDNIVAAIREHDIAAAKRWDAVGHAVDQRLAA